MKKSVLFLFCIFSVTLPSIAQDSAFIFKPVIPIRIDREVNIAYDICIKNAVQGDILSNIVVKLDGDATNYVEKIELYYTGTVSMVRSRSKSISLSVQNNSYGGGQRVYCSPSNAILIGSVVPNSPNMIIQSSKKLVRGENFFYLSIKVRPTTSLTAKFNVSIESITVKGKSFPLSRQGFSQPYRVALSARDHGDDGVHTYRIPGLETAKDGSLLAIYDIRRNNAVDLQGDIQVGLSRSLDKGRTWLPMQVVVDMRGYNGLPDNQNGTGDAAIAVDQKSGKIWIMALWTHGIGEQLSWWNVKPAMTPEDQAAQVVVVESSDNGKTWGKPLNITSQIKDSSWHIILQGPGRGIVKSDGTIIFPIQYTDSTKTGRVPFASIVYSKDGGANWEIGAPAKRNTTEAQVVELTNGELMLNMRDNEGGSRSVMTTKDMGETWVEHSSSGWALVEPVCMASLIKVDAKDNVLRKNILIFSNPNHPKDRKNMTIKVSLDYGKTWSKDHQILLDSESNWGYSCLTMVDKNTVGILYESSTAQMLFQSVLLKDIVKK